MAGEGRNGGSKEGERELSSSHIEFPCGDITLEGEWHLPQGKGPFPVVIVCHPHSLYGGSMWSSVVIAICESLCDNGIAAFRFNFRGVGKSGGTFGGGVAEREDVRAALAFVPAEKEIDSGRTGLAGYSFGGSVVLPVALEDERVSLLALVSPALLETGWEQLKEYSRPKLVIAGDADSEIRLDLFKSYMKDVNVPGECQLVAGADHFWFGYEEELAQRVTGFFVDGFKRD